MASTDMKIRLSGIVPESVVDGTGIRFTIFTQGCPHTCEDCHNPQTHAYDGGKEFEIKELENMILKNPLLDGVTFSGGEPFVFAKELAELSKFIRANNLNIWCYTGYTLEELYELQKADNGIKAFLSQIDVLVDGRFEKSKKDLTLRFRGSSNQRLINLKAMRQMHSNEVILLAD